MQLIRIRKAQGYFCYISIAIFFLFSLEKHIEELYATKGLFFNCTLSTLVEEKQIKREFSKNLLNDKKINSLQELDSINLLIERKIQNISTESLDSGVTDIGKHGKIRFANVNSANQLYIGKANAIISVLKHTKCIIYFLEKKNALIILKPDKNNLATVVIAGGQVQVTLSSWYFETQTIGKIIGIIAHELAIHAIASEQLTELQKKKEIRYIDLEKHHKAGLNEDVIFYDKNNSADHIFAALKGNRRYEIYQQVVYEMALSMKHNISLNAGINEEDISDLIFAYLCDISIILSTNDHKEQAITELRKSASYFNLVRKDWMSFLTKKDKWSFISKLTPEEQSNRRYKILENFISSVTLLFKQEH
ncbi:hypothetical protein [Spirosoma lituiforme]